MIQNISYECPVSERELPEVMAKAAKDLIAYGIRKNFIEEKHALIERRDKSIY